MKRNIQERYLSIDIFKGLIILLMVFVNTLSIFDNVPSWTKHAPDYGLTYVDLIAPFFIFMMALNSNISFEKRIERDGSRKTYFHFIQRYLIITGIGLLLTMNPESIFLFRWGILQVLGISGLILTVFIKFKIIIQSVVASIFILIHQLIILYFFGNHIYNAIEGGFFSSLGWGSIILFSSVLTKHFSFDSKNKYFIIGGIISLLIGMFTSLIWGISRFRITLPFVFISIGASSLLYYLFYLIFDRWENNYDFFNQENFLSIMGKNSFILFILHIIIINILYYVIPLNIDTWLVFIIGFSHGATIWLFSYFLHKFEIYIIL
ncbi:MAG: heparan-alpha-glucosaminide N-acetyltransferase domain-containing protein [Promethearchaeati archaeon]